MPLKTTAHPRGSVEIYGHHNVVICVARGHIVASDTEALIDVLDSKLPLGRPLFGFYDWAEVTGYESASRVLLTKWSLSAPRGSIGGVHILFRSRLVAMGVATASLALRMMGM